MEINEIYRQLKHHHLDQDDEQELAIQIWTARESFDINKGTLSTWIATIVRNYQISKWKSKKEKEINMQIPLSHFEYEDENGNINSSISAYLACNDLSPIEQMIDKENIEKLMSELHSLKNPHRDILLSRIAGEKVNSVALVRAKQAFKNRSFKYRLENLVTQEEFYVNSFAQAAEICEYTASLVSDCYNKKKIFGGKKWKISDF